MTCRQAEELIQQALDRPLTAPQRAHLESHLTHCPTCRSAWDEYRRLAQVAGVWVRRAGHAETSAAEFTAQVMARLEPRPVSPPLWPRLLALSLTLAVLAILSPVAAPWLPHATRWVPNGLDLRTDGLWAAAQGALAARWAVFLLLPALAANTLFVLRARRVA